MHISIRPVAVALLVLAATAWPASAEQVGSGGATTEAMASASMIEQAGSNDRLYAACAYSPRIRPDGSRYGHYEGDARHLTNDAGRPATPWDVKIACEFRGTPWGDVGFDTPWLPGHAWVEGDGAFGRPREICVHAYLRMPSGLYVGGTRCVDQRPAASGNGWNVQVAFEHGVLDAPDSTLRLVDQCIHTDTCAADQYAGRLAAMVAERPRASGVTVTAGEHTVRASTDLCTADLSICLDRTRSPEPSGSGRASGWRR